MPTYDRVHLASCLADAVRAAVENLRDDPAVSHLQFHVVINGGDYRGETLYALAYGYLEDGLVSCKCGAIASTSHSASVAASLVVGETEVYCDHPGHRAGPHMYRQTCVRPTPVSSVRTD